MSSADTIAVTVEAARAGVQSIEIKRDTMRDFAMTAAMRGISTRQLFSDVLNAVAGDDLFKAVLER